VLELLLTSVYAGMPHDLVLNIKDSITHHSLGTQYTPTTPRMKEELSSTYISVAQGLRFSAAESTIHRRLATLDMTTARRIRTGTPF